MARRGHLDVPVIGVAKSGWTLDQMRARARDSVTRHGGLDPAVFPQLESRLRYVDGDYRDPSTYAALRAALGEARRPAHYLAIPPSMFPTVVEGLGRAGCARDARVIIEKPFGRDLESARSLNATLHAAFDVLLRRSVIFRRVFAGAPGGLPRSSSSSDSPSPPPRWSSRGRVR